MKIDWYTKGILTVIAASLLVLSWSTLQPAPATAQMLGATCGQQFLDPCYVEISESVPLTVDASGSLVTVTGFVEVSNTRPITVKIY